VEGVLRLLGTLILALDQPAAPGSSDATSATDIISLISHASWVVKGVLIVLVCFSAVSWGIILYKELQLRRARGQTGTFLGVFRKSSRFSEVQAVCASLASSRARADRQRCERRDLPAAPPRVARFPRRRDSEVGCPCCGASPQTT